MKTLTKFAWIFPLLALGTVSKAQLINNFYHSDVKGPADHGQGDKVITAVPSDDYPERTYVVAGASRLSLKGESPSVSLSRYALDGTTLYHRTFVINSADAGDFTSVKGLVEVTSPAASGFAILAYTNTATTQSVLIRTGEHGHLIWKREVGFREAASLAYDKVRDRLLVLTRVGEDATADLQLVVVDAKSGVVIYTRHLDGFRGSDDEPSTVLYDPHTQDYLLTGTTKITFPASVQSRLMLVRLDNNGKLVYTRVIGDEAEQLTAVSATIIPAGPASRVVIGGSVTGLVENNAYTNQPAYTTVDIATGKLAGLHVIQKQFDLKALTFEPLSGDLDIVGNKDLAGKGIQSNLFSIDPANPAGIGSDHVFNKEPSTSAFNDIAPGPGTHVVMTGYHQFPVLWAGSPPNLNYPWLTTADAEGTGACEVSADVQVVRTRLPHLSSASISSAFLSSEVDVREESQDELVLNGCDLDFRLIAPAGSAGAAQFKFYPNPASSVINVEYTTASNAEVILSLIDVTGRVVLNQRLAAGEHMTGTVNLSDYASGVYYSDLKVNGQSVTKEKIAVQH
ncbi:MAG TPA: T9SS type A sorting domain-containing protein [Bacteroidia bacterium]|jgi:hypothetical protein|nr:T9SS type A sorting domain-containing protein [Bacteroidia bacterium]